MPLRPLVISGNMLAVPASRQHSSCARRAFAQSYFTLKLLWTALNCSKLLWQVREQTPAAEA